MILLLALGGLSVIVGLQIVFAVLFQRLTPAVAVQAAGQATRASTTGLTPASLFKFLLIGNLFGLMAFYVAMGILAACGFGKVDAFGTIVDGPLALLASIVIWPIIATIKTFLDWVVIGFGYWIYSRWAVVG
ncbi:MAG: hypothetical protein ACKOOI_06735, partial [Pirellula sp.]